MQDLSSSSPMCVRGHRVNLMDVSPWRLGLGCETQRQEMYSSGHAVQISGRWRVKHPGESRQLFLRKASCQGFNPWYLSCTSPVRRGGGGSEEGRKSRVHRSKWELSGNGEWKTSSILCCLAIIIDSISKKVCLRVRTARHYLGHMGKMIRLGNQPFIIDNQPAKGITYVSRL